MDKFAYLVMVTSNANNNKFYKMTQVGESDSFMVDYGRIGNTSSQSCSYSMSQWNKKYNEKVRKGYVDQTRLYAKEMIKVNTTGFKPIENPSISAIVYRLQVMAKETIDTNYTVASTSVTQAMIKEAQGLIDGLSLFLNGMSLDEFNKRLLELFTVIPRKMHSVSSYLASRVPDFDRIIQREQDLLDVMAGQVNQNDAEEEEIEDVADGDSKTILEAMGIEFENVDKDDIIKIKDAMSDTSGKFVAAWRVKNLRTQGKFDKFVADNNVKDIKLLFHGSRNENFWSIINNGLMIRPANAIRTGSMFGNGIYFAPRARKSLGYTSLENSYWARGNSKTGFMLLNEVAYGVSYDVYDFESRLGSFNYKMLQQAKNGAHCLHAHASQGMLRNDEIVVYKEDQVTVKYLIELRS